MLTNCITSIYNDILIDTVLIECTLLHAPHYIKALCSKASCLSRAWCFWCLHLSMSDSYMHNCNYLTWNCSICMIFSVPLFSMRIIDGDCVCSLGGHWWIVSKSVRRHVSSYLKITRASLISAATEGGGREEGGREGGSCKYNTATIQRFYHNSE